MGKVMGVVYPDMTVSTINISIDIKAARRAVRKYGGLLRALMARAERERRRTPRPLCIDGHAYHRRQRTRRRRG